MYSRPDIGLFIKSIEFLLPRCRSITIAIVSVFIAGSSTYLLSAEELTSGTSSRKAKQQSLQAIPYHQLTQQANAKIKDVLQKPSIYRRLPITSINVDPDYFIFLTRHPEVIVNIWKLMGVTKMTTTRTGPFTLKSNDGVGTVSDIELLYGTNNLHIFYSQGTYEGPLLRRKLRGECVLILHTSYNKMADGKPTAISQLDVFLKIENATAGLIAKTLNPLVGPTADHNFVESLKFLQRLNETTEKNGVGVQRMAGRLTDISNETRNQFVEMAGLVYQRGQGNAAAKASQIAVPPSNYPRQTHPTSSYLPHDSGALSRPQVYHPAVQAGYAAPLGYGYPQADRIGTQPQGTQPQTYGVNPTGYQQPLEQYQQNPTFQRSVEQPPRGFFRPLGRRMNSPRTSRLPYQAPTYPQENYYRR